MTFTDNNLAIYGASDYDRMFFAEHFCYHHKINLIRNEVGDGIIEELDLATKETKKYKIIENRNDDGTYDAVLIDYDKYLAFNDFYSERLVDQINTEYELMK